MVMHKKTLELWLAQSSFGSQRNRSNLCWFQSVRFWIFRRNRAGEGIHRGKDRTELNERRRHWRRDVAVGKLVRTICWLRRVKARSFRPIRRTHLYAGPWILGSGPCGENVLDCDHTSFPLAANWLRYSCADLPNTASFAVMKRLGCSFVGMLGIRWVVAQNI